MIFSRKMRLVFRKLTIKSLFYTIVCLFFTSYIVSSIFFAFIYTKDFIYPFHQYFPDDVSCYYLKSGEESVSNDYFKTPTNDVFMHSTSCHLNLKPAHLCSIEAASNAYSKSKVRVLFNKPLSFCACQKKLIEILMKKGNLEFVRIDIEKYLNDTPFRNITGPFRNSVFNRGMRKYKKVEEVLKLATLYKFGGKVIDLDVIVTKLVGAKKWLAYDEDQFLSSAALSFYERGSSIVKKTIELLPTTLNSNDDELQTNIAITKAYDYLCDSIYSIAFHHDHNIRAECAKLKLLSFEFVTVKYSESARPLPTAYAFRIVDEVKEYHIPQDSLIAEIAKKYCPIVYNYTVHSK